MSIRLRILNALLRGVGRPVLRRAKSPRKARRDFELTARFVFRGQRRAAARRDLGGVSCLESVERCQGAGPVLLFFHGGGYIAGSARSHLPMVGHLAAEAGVCAVLPDYRLAPEHPFPAAFEDALAVWQALRAEGLEARDIILGGDSAGGGLALALLGYLVEKEELPAGLFAMSPWTDLTCSGASLDENAARDAILPVDRIRELRAMVAPDADPEDPRLSPLFADFHGSCPVYLQASESEILRDDTLRLAERLRAASVDVHVDTWPDAPHVWQIFRGWVPEADDALARIATFIGGLATASRPRSGS